MDDKQVNAYIKWLASLVGIALGSDSYATFRYLYDTDYYWELHDDENRAQDALNLRERYLDEHGSIDAETEAHEKPASVLEVLVAFAQRIEDSIMYDPDEGDRTALWFFLMIENLGLDTYIWSTSLPDKALIGPILDVWMGRQYKKDGRGG